MAKADLLKEAKAAGLVAEDAEEDAYTVAELEAILAPAQEDAPAWEGSLSDVPVVPAPDGYDTQKDYLADA